MGLAGRPGGTRRWAGLLLAASLVADIGAAVVVLRPGGPSFGVADPRPTASPTLNAGVVTPEELRRAAIEALLERRADAVLRGNREAFLATVDHRQSDFLARQRSAFEGLLQVPIGTWKYVLDPSREVDTASSFLAGYTDPVWVPDLALHYQLRGFDPEPTQLSMHYTFIEVAGRWLIADDADFPGVEDLESARELWDFGPIEVLRGADAMVLGHAGQTSFLTPILRDTEAAIPAVTAVVGADWPQRVVVVVPKDTTELVEIVDTASNLSQIAAVAIAQIAGADGRYRAVGNRIVVNPPNFRRLSRLGRRIVMRHEITHVATRAYTGAATPTWLVEGFADHVGYLGSGVATRVAAKELRDEIRAGRLPDRLPNEDDFDGSSARLSQAYESSWLACRLIAERAGQDALVRFYKAVGTGLGPIDEVVRRAFKDVLQTTPEQFVESWRAYLRAQLG